MPVEWWLDESALPDLVWARLSTGTPGEPARVRDIDGVERVFPSREAAVAWLSEDEYVPLEDALDTVALPEPPTPPNWG